MINRIFIFYIMTLLLTGCGHPKFDIVKPPTADENNRALITIYRDGKRAGSHHWIKLNGRYIAELKEKEYTQFYVSSGTHEIYTVCTLPTYHFDRFMKPYDPSAFYMTDPYVANGLDMCYQSSERESALGGNCVGIKLTGQEDSVCDEMRKKLSLVVPGTNQ